jgi:hypothetical protein
MNLNSFTFKRLLLIGGLLVVMGQGLWTFPELQDYFFPDKNLELILLRAGKDIEKIEDNLVSLNERIEYLKWFQTHDGANQKISWDRLLSFPFSESIRPLAPKYFWRFNILFAHKPRMRAESRLRRLDALFKNLINGDFRVVHSHARAAMPPSAAAVSRSMQQILEYQEQCKGLNSKLTELSKQLMWFADHGYDGLVI